MDKMENRKELKRIFKGYRRMTPEIARELKKHGIIVVRKRNHVILNIACADGFRMVSISSTGSDKREGLNFVSKIMKTIGAD